MVNSAIKNLISMERMKNDIKHDVDNVSFAKCSTNSNFRFSSFDNKFGTHLSIFWKDYRICKKD